MAPILYLILQALLRFRLVSMVDLEIDLTAPINPVETGNMLSIHCRIQGLSISSHTVTITRNMSGSSERLAMDDTILNQDERFFLAYRRLQDNAVVFFLSIIDITREDEGIYNCILRDKDTLLEIVRDSVTVLFKYFPADIYPICSPSETDLPDGLAMIAGQQMSLNCSSELGNPEVTMEWTKDDRVIESSAEGRTESGLSFVELTFTTAMDDDQAIYICKIKSIAFPENQRSCHVGPFKITPDPSAPVTKKPQPVPPNKIPNRPPHLPEDKTRTTMSPGETRHSKSGGDGGPTYITADCSDVCEENILYWVIATIIAGTLAIVFCIIGIIIFVRYRRRRKEENKKKENSRNSHYQNREAIYAEVETRGDEGVGEGGPGGGGGGGSGVGGGAAGEAGTIQVQRGEPGLIQVQRGEPGTIQVQRGEPGTIQVQRGEPGTIQVQRGEPGTIQVQRGEPGTIQVQRLGRIGDGEGTIQVQRIIRRTPGAPDENKLFMALDTSSYISTIDTSRSLPESEPLYNQNQPTSSVEDPYSTRNVTHTTFGL